MSPGQLVLLVVAAGAALVSPCAPAFAATDPEAFEDEVVQALGDVVPETIELLERAEEARQSGDNRTARTLYRDLLVAVPGFMHAQRRLCGIESELGNSREALALCEAALAQEQTPENLGVMAMVLLETSNIVPGSSAHTRSRVLARQAVEADPDSSIAWAALCVGSLIQKNFNGLRDCSAHLVRLQPENPGGYYFAAIYAGESGLWDAARVNIEAARLHGLPDEAYDPVDEIIGQHEPVWPTIAKWCLIAVGVWLAVMLVLFLVGAVLSRMTMNAAERMATAGADAPAQAGASLRRMYRAVLRASCVFYYLSLPALALFVIVTGVGIIYAFWAAGAVPVKLVLIVGVVAVVTVGAIFKGMFARGRDEDPGKKLDLNEHPGLRDVLDEVAARIETKPVDSVYITPGTDIAVFERGALSTQMRGRSERCLILGVGVIDRMPVASFKAILAHEYGHFTNRDTADGGFALAVRRSLVTMGVSLAEGGSAAWYNPAWIFFRGFFAVFQRISQGASRLQEIMADRWAVLNYGASNFESGLRLAIARSVEFESHVDRTLEEVVEHGRPLTNLYAYEPAAAASDVGIAEEIEAAINREPSQYDSHPSPADRFRWAHAMGAPDPDDDASEDVWSLFGDRDALERAMTAEVRWNIESKYGVEIPSA